MNSTTRYILTATAVGAGLLTVGATANAIVGNNVADSAPIGPAVVVPSSDPVPSSTTGSGPEEVDVPGVVDLDDLAATPGSTDFATSTPPAGGLGDDNSDDNGADSDEREGGDD
jgi:hypothetical protein